VARPTGPKPTTTMAELMTISLVDVAEGYIRPPVA